MADPQRYSVSDLAGVEPTTAPAGDRISLADVAAIDPPEPDRRSWFARTVDRLSEPTAPGQWLQQKAKDFSDWITTPRLSDSQTTAMLKGALGGATEGAGNVAASFSSPLGLAAGVSGVGAERAGAAGLVNAARALRGIEAASGAAFGARGLEQAVEAPTIAEKALGVAQAAGGALGVRGGMQGLRGPSSAPVEASTSPRGFLRAAPFTVNDAGVVARPGETIPMMPAPDGSYVRAVPAEYATRDIRGYLPAGPGFVAPEEGPAMSLEQAEHASFPTRAALEDVARIEPSESSVRSVPAAPLAYTFEGRKLVPAVYSGDVNARPAPHVDLDPVTAYALRWIKQDMEAIPFTPRSFVDTVRRGSDRDVTGGAAGASIYRAIVGDEGREISGATRGDVLRAIQNLEQGKLTKTGELVLGVARQLGDGNRRVTQMMMTSPPDFEPGPVGVSHAAATADALTVPEFAAALAHEGETPIADVPFALTAEAARSKAVQPSLLGAGIPQRARGLSSGEQQGIDVLDRFLSDVHGPDATLGGNGTYREPGEEGQINSTLLARMGLGGAGAAYGYATGDETADKLKRAAVFGAAGFAAPSLLGTGAGRGFLRSAPSVGSGVLRTPALEAPPTGPARLFTPKPGVMPNGAIPSAKPMPPEQKYNVDWLGRYSPELRSPIARTFQEYDAFEPQRRFRVPDARVDALAQHINVDLTQARPGSIGNVEESRAMANATATLFDRAKAVRAQLAQQPDSPALTTELGKLYQDGAVLLGNVRANASEQGRALRGQQIINAALKSYDERILADAQKRLGPQLHLFAEQLAKLPDDPIAFYRLLREHVQQQQGPLSTVFPFLYANVLSGPATWLKAALGTGTNFAFQGATNLVAGVLEARKPLEQRSVLLSEPAAAWSALGQGLLRGGKAAAFILRHGFDPLAIERGEIPAMAPELPGGVATNFGPRMLKAIHGAFLGEAARAYEATGMAYAQAAKEAASARLSGEALSTFLARRTAELSQAPDIQNHAAQWAQRVTFMEDPGRIGNAFGQLVNSSKALKFLQLFWRVPWNIARQQFTQNTAAAFLSPFAESSGVYAGGRLGAQAQARALLGTALLAPFAAAVGSGLVTGAGPEDPKRRPLWLDTHRPNSLRIGNQWQDYRALPIAEPLSVLANAFEAYHEGRASDDDVNQIVGALAARMGNVVTSQPYLAGITEFINAMERPAEAGSTLMKGAAQTVVPYAGLLRNVTRTVDPTIREVHSPLDAAKEIIPGLSSNLAPRLGVFGEPLQRPGNAASRFLAPSLPVAMSGDPLKTALDAMDAPLPNDRRVTSVPLVPGVRAAVPPVLDQQRRQQGGAELRGVLEPLLASPQFRALPAEQQHEIVARLMAQIRGNARANLDAVVKTQAVTNPNLLRGALLQQLQGAR